MNWDFAANNGLVGALMDSASSLPYGLASDVLSCLAFLSTIGFTLSSVEAVLTIAYVGELTGVEECTMWTNRLGLLNSVTLVFFLIGALFLIASLIVHGLFFYVYWQALLIAIVGAAILVLFYVGVVNLKQQSLVYEIKAYAANTSPAELSIAEIDDFAKKFINSCGKGHLNQDTLVEFIRKEQTPEKEWRMKNYSTATLKLIGAVADMIVQQHVEEELVKSQFWKPGSIMRSARGGGLSMSVKPPVDDLSS